VRLEDGVLGELKGILHNENLILKWNIFT
jgi:hypothetical protein